MTHREQFFAVLEGRRPDRPAFFPDVSDWYVAARTPPGQVSRGGSGAFIPDADPMHRQPGSMPPELKDLTYLGLYRHFDWGLPVHLYGWFEVQRDGWEQSVRLQGRQRITAWRTPKGSLEKVDVQAADGSWAPVVHLAKEVGDLQVILWAVQHSRFVPHYERIEATLEAIGQQGVGDVVLMRSPFGKLVHEYLGFEKVVYALHDEPSALLDFMQLQEQSDLELAHLAAAAPARLVILSDHADENLIAPSYYRDYCIPYYRKLNAILHKAGKLVSTHLDGNFRGFFPLLAQTGFDLLDGCTPAPMMNYEVEELAAALPAGMSCYCGVPATLLCQRLPTRQICDFGRRILRAFAGRAILNIGDILPPDADIRQVIALGQMAREWTNS